MAHGVLPSGDSLEEENRRDLELAQTRRSSYPQCRLLVPTFPFSIRKRRRRDPLNKAHEVYGGVRVVVGGLRC